MTDTSNDELEDTKPRKAYRHEENFSDELVGLRSNTHTENFVQDIGDTPKMKPYHRTMASDLEDTQPNQVFKIRGPRIVARKKFNWPSFWTMLLSIAIVVILVIFVPGPFDEIGAAIALSAVNAFIANYRK